MLSVLFPAVPGEDTGRVQVEFSGVAGKAYVIEASNDMVYWQMIGVAWDRGDGRFHFEDPETAQFSLHFYRVVAP